MSSPEERDEQALREKIARLKQKIAQARQEVPTETPQAPAVAIEIDVPMKGSPAAVAPEVQPPMQSTRALPVVQVPAQPIRQMPRPVSYPAPVAQPVKKTGWFDWLFKPKAVRPAVPQVQSRPVLPAVAIAPRITSPAVARAEFIKAKETEADLILRDITVNVEKEVAAAATASPGQATPVHRRYLLKRQEAAGKQAVPAKSTENTELALMASELYPSVKPEEKPKEAPAPVAKHKPLTLVERREAAKTAIEAKKAAQTKPATGTAPQAGKQALTLEEILGKPGASQENQLFGGPAPAAQAEGNPLFAQLGDINTGTAPKQVEQPAVQQKPKEAVASECPTCHSKNIKIVFCPYCGAGMCFNCSPLVKPEPEAMIYTCPKCGEEVTVRKKA